MAIWIVAIWNQNHLTLLGIWRLVKQENHRDLVSIAFFVWWTQVFTPQKNVMKLRWKCDQPENSLKSPLNAGKHILNSRCRRLNIFQACQTSREKLGEHPNLNTKFLQSNVDDKPLPSLVIFIATPQDVWVGEASNKPGYLQLWDPMKDNILRLIETWFKQHLEHLPNKYCRELHGNLLSPSPGTMAVVRD